MYVGRPVKIEKDMSSSCSRPASLGVIFGMIQIRMIRNSLKKHVDGIQTYGNNFLHMDRNDIERELIETIREVQEMSGDAPAAIDTHTCPIKDLEHFDSLRGVETTVLLSMKLKCEFKSPKGEINLFVSKDGRRILSVGEIVDRLVKLCE